MFCRIVRFPFVLILLASFALNAFSGLPSSAQTLMVGEYLLKQTLEYGLNGNKIGLFASDPARSRFLGMTFDRNGYSYVANGDDNGVSIFTPNGKSIGHFVIPRAHSCSHVTIDNMEYIYVSSYYTSIVYRISPAGVTTNFASAPYPLGLAFDKNGNLYVSSGNNNIYKFSSTGSSMGIFASGLPAPGGLDCDAAGNLYVACEGTSGTTSDEIRRFAPDGTRLLSWTSPYLSQPVNVKFGPDGNLYVAEFTNKTVYRFSSNGVGDQSNFITGLNAPFGLAFKPVSASPVTVSGTAVFEGIAPTAPVQNVTFEFRVFGVKAFPSQTVAVAPSGGFSLTNVPRGNYSLHIKGAKYLAKNVIVDATNGDVSGVVATLLAGDANNDNSVDSTDFGILIGAFNTSASLPGSGYDATADFNGDGYVDSTDFGLLIGNFNEMGDQ